MSSNTPGPTDGPTSRPSGTPAVEYLGDQQPASSTRSRRTGLVVAGTAVAVAAAGAGVFAVTQFMSGGPAPATAVPSDAFGYLALDLDPNGAQKYEAMKTLRKFPVVREELGVDAGDDLRRVLYKAITVDEPCPEIDYDDDIDPWLGGKLAVAAVPGEDEPVPFFVVQVKDQELAEDAIGTIAGCADEEEFGTAFVGDFMVVAETGDIAAEIASDAEESSLADDAEFGRWIDEAGGSGIVEAYVSAEAPQYFAEEAEMPIGGELDEMTGASALVGPSELTPTSTETPDVEAAFEDFQGGAMVVRFDDEAVEVEMAAGGLPSQVSTGGNSGMEDLPATTAMAFGFGVADTAVQEMIDGLAESMGMGQDEVDEMLSEAEAETGLELPEDLQTLLGEGLSVAVDSSMDLQGLTEGTGEPGEIPVGVRIVGDTDAITEVLDKVLASIGPVAQGVVVEEGDGVVAIALEPEYAQALAEDGALGDEDRFQAALDQLDGSAGAFFVDFDAGDWLTELAATDSDERIEENVAPLDSLGISGDLEEDVVHGIMRLTTD
jgi:hypothetical protein